MSRIFPLLLQFGWNSQREIVLPLMETRQHSLLIGLPWDMIAPHEVQAKRNHGGQTLERLASRGGLSHAEAFAVLMDRDFRRMDFPEANERLRKLLGAWVFEQAANPSPPQLSSNRKDGGGDE